MRVLLIHNDYGGYSGEEYICDRVRAILEERGHAVAEYRRSSRELEAMPFARAQAFFRGIHSAAACRDVRRVLKSFRPDVVHLQNVFPLISPSVLRVCRSAGIPIVMNVQNFRLACPNGLLFSHGEICHRCVSGREYWCVLRNCEGSPLKSAGYALRTLTARVRRSFLGNVDVYITPTEFHRRWLSSIGVDETRIHVVPNMVDVPDAPGGHSTGDYVGFVGRVSPEKGVAILLEAARRLPHIPFRIAGNYDRQPDLPGRSPPNVDFLGTLSGDSLAEFYERMRMLVVPSVWYEGLPTVIPQAMLRGKVVIASDVGGLSYAVADGVTGRLFRLCDPDALAACITSVWHDDAARTAMGEAARAEAMAKYSSNVFYRKLMHSLQSALDQRVG